MTAQPMMSASPFIQPECGVNKFWNSYPETYHKLNYPFGCQDLMTPLINQNGENPKEELKSVRTPFGHL